MARRSQLPLMTTENGAVTAVTRDGSVFLFDEADLPLVSPYSWHVNDRGYVVSGARVNGKALRMHRFLTSAPEGTEVDHINRNKSDNRRSNLRLATKDQNQWNRPRMKTNSSGYIGVYLHKDTGKWAAILSIGNRNRHLGLFFTPEEAASARDAAVLSHRGEFATLNAAEHTRQADSSGLLHPKEFWSGRRGGRRNG